MYSLPYKFCLSICIVVITFSQMNYVFFIESTKEKSEKKHLIQLNLSFKGFCYSPFRDLGPIGGELASESLVREDLTILKQLNVANIRTYGVGLNQIIIPKIANEYGITCATGVWIGTNNTENIKEIEKGLSVANVSSMLIIGNEVLFKGDLAETELIEYINHAKNQTSIPVTTAEPWYTWLDHPDLAKISDMLLIHIHPFWESSVFIDEPSGPEILANYTISIFNQVQETFPNKEVIITETGWPSDGRLDCSEETQKQYYKALIPLLLDNCIKYYTFEAFDEIWKHELWQGDQNSDVGPHWGVFKSDRTKKLAIDIFSEWYGGDSSIFCKTTTNTTSQTHQDETTDIYRNYGFEIYWGLSVVLLINIKKRIKE